MATAQEIKQTLAKVHDLTSLVNNLLVDTLVLLRAGTAWDNQRLASSLKELRKGITVERTKPRKT